MSQDDRNDIAIADAKYVLTWLLQIDEEPKILFSLPNNIRQLSERALKIWSEEPTQ